MKKIFLLSILFGLLNFSNSYAAQCGAKIVNETVFKVLMLEYESTNGKKFMIRIEADEPKILTPTELKSLNSAKKIILHKYYPHRDGGKKTQIGTIEPERFRLPGFYMFWHCAIHGGICIHGQTEKDGKLVKMSHATW